MTHLIEKLDALSLQIEEIRKEISKEIEKESKRQRSFSPRSIENSKYYQDLSEMMPGTLELDDNNYMTAKDIQTLLFESYGLNIDYRVLGRFIVHFFGECTVRRLVDNKQVKFYKLKRNGI